MKLVKLYAGFRTILIISDIALNGNLMKDGMYFCSKDNYRKYNVNLSTHLTFHNAIIQKQNTVLADEIGTSNQATLCFVD